MKQLIILTLIILGTVYGIYEYPATPDGEVFIDDAFPQEKKRYDTIIKRGETVQLIDYDIQGNKKTIVKTIKQQQVDPNPEVQPQLEDPKTLELGEPTDHRYNRSDYIGMIIQKHTMDKKQIYRRARIQYRCDQYAVDCDLPLRIAFEESRYRPEAKHGCKWYSKYQKEVCSSAGGMFQFIDKTWKSSSKSYLGSVGNKYDGEHNIRTAIQKIKNEGPSAWNASKSKWSSWSSYDYIK